MIIKFLIVWYRRLQLRLLITYRDFGGDKTLELLFA